MEQPCPDCGALHSRDDGEWATFARDKRIDLVLARQRADDQARVERKRGGIDADK